MTSMSPAPGPTPHSRPWPSAEVLRAFGATGEPTPLAGGRGLTWRAGAVVLRPAGEGEEAVWKSEVLAALAVTDEFTVPRPLPSIDGGWVREGWEALEWIPGATDQWRVDDIVRAATAFHRAIAHLPQPAFVARSTDRWSIADRMAWGDEPLGGATPGDQFGDPLLAALTHEYDDVEAPPQVIHGDLLGNVMFAERRPPAIIDWAPYWRPAGLGAAIAVVDAACWHGLPAAAVADDHGLAEWRQLTLRALVFRIATQHLLGRWDDDFARRHAPVAEAVIALP